MPRCINNSVERRLAFGFTASQVDQQGRTSNPKIYAGGDNTLGPDLVVTAIAAGVVGRLVDDEEVAALASYLRSAWGNTGGAVTAQQVAEQR